VGRYRWRAAPCERWVRAISLQLDGEASELEAAALARHLLTCQRCREIATETAATTQLLREAPLLELGRPVTVVSPQRARKQFVRRGSAVLVVAAGLAVASAVTWFSDAPPKHPSSALSFRNVQEQQRFVRGELRRLEPETVFAAKTPPRFAGHDLI
jgi:anti-sigma factor RsiW